MFENQQARRALGAESSGFAYGRRSTAASPDSENIEHTRTGGSSAKLFERGANPRQPGEFFLTLGLKSVSSPFLVPFPRVRLLLM